MSTSQIRVDEVVVGERARRDYGDLTSLVESIREHGLLQPIGLTPGNDLLFGGRRLEAAKRLGMVEISVTRPVTRTDVVSLLRAERDENVCRKDMTPEELVNMGLRIEKLEKPAAKERQTEGQRRGGEVFAGRQAWSPGGVQASDPEPRRTVNDDVGEALGLSRNTYTRMKHVVATARNQDEKPEVQETAQDALTKMNAGAMAAATAERIVRASRNGDDARKTPQPPASELTRPQPPKFGGNRRKHAEVIDSISNSLSGLATVADGITEFDNTVTTEEAARLADGLTTSIRSLNRLKQTLTRKATS